MAIALGKSAEDEARDNLHLIADRMAGNVGLFFTLAEPQEVQE